MDDKRSARRRRILENADNRLKKVTAIQSSSRMPFEGPEQSDIQNDTNNEALPPLGLKPESRHEKEPQAVNTSTISSEDKSIGGDEKQDCDSRKSMLNEELDSQSDQPSKQTNIKERLEAVENLESEEEENEIQTASGKCYRFFMISLLAVLLVVSNSWEYLFDNQPSNQKNTMLLPYFATLELVNFVLFPVLTSETQKPSMLVLLLAMIGALQSSNSIALTVFAYGSRLFEDLAIFVFSVVTMNSLLTYCF